MAQDAAGTRPRSSSFFPKAVGPTEASLWSVRLGMSTRRRPHCLADRPLLTGRDWEPVLEQAQALGARTLVFWIDSRDVLDECFTVAQAWDGSPETRWVYCERGPIDGAAARTCHDMNLSIVLRLDAPAPDVTRWIHGDPSALPAFGQTLDNLVAAGYPSLQHAVGVHFSLTAQNRSVGQALWHHLRQRRLQPHFDLALKWNHALREGKDRRPAKINWGDGWTYERRFAPPWTAPAAAVEAHTCFIDRDGTVFPNEHLLMPLGSIHHQSLRAIVEESEFFQDLRRYRVTLKGPCRMCIDSAQCLGSRTAAFARTGDYLASDPTCWKNQDKSDQIDCLPMALAPILPQKESMRVVDTLHAIGEKSGTVTTTLRPDMPMISSDGALDVAFFLEMMAQAIAGVTVFKKHGSAEREAEGLLLAAQNVAIFHRPQVGETLTIDVRKTAIFGDFGMVHGRIRSAGRTVCSGDIKFWHRVERADSSPEERE